ncbi:MAG TPA: hypothetical protein DET40_14925 [Lentisphaeria bacterium]|nr:MAG: hypothetical protein A2X45_06200 [Lentisphaerae bacterium GWF2_50_93]HCE44831.1 hypothetical protein [Lentisphaeria bacterium]
MKTVASILILSVAIIVSSGCSSSRSIAAPYDQVSAAAQEKFNVNTWTMYDTRKSWKNEKPGKDLKITYYDWSFPDTKVYCVVEVVAEKGGGSTVYVFVKDYESWLAPMTWSTSSAVGILDLFEKRMTAGTWDLLPWEEKVEARRLK